MWKFEGCIGWYSQISTADKMEKLVLLNTLKSEWKYILQKRITWKFLNNVNMINKTDTTSDL